MYGARWGSCGRSCDGVPGIPGRTTWMRSASSPNHSPTSSATNCESVWTCAPRATARRISPGYSSVSGVHSSGKRTGVRSCTLTSATPRVGGTTKFVPCTTSTRPVHHSIGARSDRFHTARSGRAGIGPRCRVAACPRPRNVTAKGTSSTGRSSGSAVAAVAVAIALVRSASSSSATRWPMPLRRPSIGVTSMATRRGAAAFGLGVAIGDEGRAHRGGAASTLRSRGDVARARPSPVGGDPELRDAPVDAGRRDPLGARVGGRRRRRSGRAHRGARRRQRLADPSRRGRGPRSGRDPERRSGHGPVAAARSELRLRRWQQPGHRRRRPALRSRVPAQPRRGRGARCAQPCGRGADRRRRALRGRRPEDAPRLRPGHHRRDRQRHQRAG